VNETPRPGLMDQLVELLARLMDAVGLNGRRLRWRWNQRRERLGETGVRTEMLLRSAKGRHKMCPGCRALVPRSAATCPECGVTLSTVNAPSVGRLLSNLLPGATAATSLIMLVNGFWFVIMLIAQVKAGAAAGGSGGLFGGFGGELLVRFGSGLSRPLMLTDGQVAGGEWWRLITPIFLHGGLLHFFFNSYMLMQLGPIVEEIYGTERFWVTYLGCGVAGSMTSQLPRLVNTVGASGAIMGLIGLLLVHGLRGGGVLGDSMKRLVVRLGIYMVILSLFFNLDHLNHAGGFACGALFALVLPTRPFRGRPEAAVWQALSLAGVLLVLYAFAQVALQGAASS
jgi:membrane associated rhomboid family serine protease